MWYAQLGPHFLQTPSVPVEHWVFQQKEYPKLPLFLTVVTLSQGKLELYFQIFLQQSHLIKEGNQEYMRSSHALPCEPGKVLPNAEFALTLCFSLAMTLIQQEIRLDPQEYIAKLYFPPLPKPPLPHVFRRLLSDPHSFTISSSALPPGAKGIFGKHESNHVLHMLKILQCFWSLIENNPYFLAWSPKAISSAWPLSLNLSPCFVLLPNTWPVLPAFYLWNRPTCSLSGPFCTFISSAQNNLPLLRVVGSFLTQFSGPMLFPLTCLPWPPHLNRK